MSRLDFHFEFKKEVPFLGNNVAIETEQRLRDLAKGHTDIIGAAVVIKELAQEETPHAFQSRVTAYIRPDNIVAVEKADSANMAINKAVKAVERQVRHRREKFRKRWTLPEQVTDQGVYQLSAREIYQTFVKWRNPAELLEMERTDLATQLMTDHKLDEAAAFYAADQILSAATDMRDEAGS